MQTYTPETHGHPHHYYTVTTSVHRVCAHQLDTAENQRKQRKETLEAQRNATWTQGKKSGGIRRADVCRRRQVGDLCDDPECIHWPCRYEQPPRQSRPQEDERDQRQAEQRPSSSREDEGRRGGYAEEPPRGNRFGALRQTDEEDGWQQQQHSHRGMPPPHAPHRSGRGRGWQWNASAVRARGRHPGAGQ